MVTDARTRESSPAADEAALLVRLGQRQYGLCLGLVERVLPIAHVLSLPDTGPGVLGMLNLHGEVMPVVDPRPRLGLPTPPVSAEHRMVLVRGSRPFLLWVDAVDEVVGLSSEDLAVVPVQQSSPLVPRVLRLGRTLVPLLAPTALEPRASVR